MVAEVLPLTHCALSPSTTFSVSTVGFRLQGGCIYATDVASVVVVDCNFTANGKMPGATDPSTDNGAAIAITGSRTSDLYPVNLVVLRSKFANNTANEGGAIMAVQYLNGRGRVEVHDCRFFGNIVSLDMNSCSGAWLL